MDTTSLEDWNKAHETKAFKEEFFPQWFSKEKGCVTGRFDESIT
jgi:hypothetical protein